ncbi:MAG TPA: hypothetical protein VHX59_15745 [Mycobacteriales bacterium]|jgi:dipeptidase E|nr:hypothetical protein [Mycobacteriales bacterium]
MNLLLTSAGISNPSIYDALVDLLGKPISETSALFIPTAIYPFPGGAGRAWQAITGTAPSPLCELGWKSLGVLELTALPTIREENWVPMVREADALLVWGGDVLYLTHWMRKSGLANIQKWASGSPAPTYATDDQTAITVIDGAVEVVSEENWTLCNPDA